ncbi:hypothetical protein [Microcoleus sp. D2_18a_B4]|uniref:hypothetical protein n=1 Tax=Microcoleus sp. D2_18a_B4 TaxID=3055329 RepID=UPI002FCF3097
MEQASCLFKTGFSGNVYYFPTVVLWFRHTLRRESHDRSQSGIIPILYKTFFPSASLISREKIFIDLATRGRSPAGYLSWDVTGFDLRSHSILDFRF